MGFEHGRVFVNLDTLLQHNSHLALEPTEDTFAVLRTEPTMITAIKHLLHRGYDVNILAFVQDSSFVYHLRKWLKAILPDLWEYNGLPESHILAIPKDKNKFDYISYPRHADVYLERDPEEAVEWRKIGTPVLCTSKDNPSWTGYIIDTNSLGEYIGKTIRGILYIEELEAR